jgi:hypothetical protein
MLACFFNTEYKVICILNMCLYEKSILTMNMHARLRLHVVKFTCLKLHFFTNYDY